MTSTKITDLYVEYASEITDAPVLYPQWLSYIVLSSVLNKNIYMSGGGTYKIYPNLYLLIIGPSSTFRKSFSQRLAISLIREIVPDFPLMDVSSTETLLAEMARQDRSPYGSAIYTIDEFSAFMKKARTSQHFAHMMEKLSSLFDHDTIHRRVGTNEETKTICHVEEPFLNLSAACSFDWLTRYTETSDITGGFLARFLWIVETYKHGEHWSEPKPGDNLKRCYIIKRLNEAKDLVLGEMKWSGEAKIRWDAWYSDFRKRNTGGKWDANYERMTGQVRKIAMLNAAQGLRLEINVEDLDSAIQMAEPLVKCLNEIVIGESREEIKRNKIFSYIRRRAPHAVKRSELQNNVNDLDSWSLDNHVRTLLDMEKIEVVTDSLDKKPGRKPIMYRAKALS